MAEQLEEGYGEITEELEVLFQELANMEISAERKFQSIAGLIQSNKRAMSMIEGEKEYLESELSRVKQKLSAGTNLEERLKSLLKLLIQVIGKQKFRDKTYSLSKTKQLVILDEETALANVPEEFIRTKREIKKTELKKAIETEGVSYSGVAVVENEHVSIR